MCETEIGKFYRDTVTGVVGRAEAKGADPAARPHGETLAVPLQSVALTQLELKRDHLGDRSDNPLPQGHDMRWYDDLRLEPVGDA